MNSSPFSESAPFPPGPTLGGMISKFLPKQQPDLGGPLKEVSRLGRVICRLLLRKGSICNEILLLYGLSDHGIKDCLAAQAFLPAIISVVTLAPN